MIASEMSKVLLPQGISVQVRVPASSANLGPGFDCLGLALGIDDELQVTVTGDDLSVEVTGEAAADVPRDGRNLIARAVTRGLAHAGCSAPGLALRCHNVVPHSRGMGSSAAAAVAGLAAASGLIRAGGMGPGLTDAELIQLAGEFEGHPDNAAASVLGGAVVTWTEAVGPGESPRFGARRLTVHPDVLATVCIPAVESSTSHTRALLPDAVPRTDAVFNVSRAALAVVALTDDPALLMAATEDRLHQGYRASAMPQTADLVTGLRAAGYAAAVSGAGPSVLVLGTEPLDEAGRELAADLGFTVRQVPVGDAVRIT